MKTKRPEDADKADVIDALLPQTQCGQCGFPGCRPYAQAIAAGRAGINRCPPGGTVTITALAELLGREPEAPNFLPTPPRRVRIEEPDCIGCTKCIQVCPVDAIVGAQGKMHTVIESDCTGCGLCLPPCPVDCIHWLLVPVPARHWLHPASVAEDR